MKNREKVSANTAAWEWTRNCGKFARIGNDKIVTMAETGKELSVEEMLVLFLTLTISKSS
ncbi:MAG TPA: hypothetical protein DCL77_19560 [Prolixibacteraceae bacterium]|nr:hypothetical protein [Prolixibacteraceae bacterium]